MPLFEGHFRHFSWPIALAMITLIAIGITAIWTVECADDSIAGCTTKQVGYALAGVLAFFVATAFDYRKLGPASYAFFAFTLILLIAVLFQPEIKGGRRWIPLIPGVFQFQPSELAKITFVVALAWYLRYRNSYRRLAGLIIPFAITLVPLELIRREPDLGTSMLLLPTLMVMLMIAGARWRHLLVVLGLGLAVVFLPVPQKVDPQQFARQFDKYDAWQLGPFTRYRPREFRRDDGSIDWTRRAAMPVSYCRCQIGDGTVFDLQPLSLAVIPEYQRGRIEGWLRREDPRIRAGKGFQQYNSMLMLGAGQVAGQHDRQAMNEYLRMLPEDHNDFIFSVVGARWGFGGSLAVLVLYAIICLFGVDVATSTDDPFGRLLSLGVVALLAAQVFINVAMTMGLMPITGMTLPLVSYGGSSLLVNCLALGLLVNVGRHRHISLAPRPFEFGGDGI
jgi:rod shape determining protein RodA